MRTAGSRELPAISRPASYEQLAEAPVLTDRALQVLERRSFTTVAVICCSYAISAAFAAERVTRSTSRDYSSSSIALDVSVLPTYEETFSRQIARFFSALMPPLIILMAINLYIASLQPTDLNAPELRGKLLMMSTFTVLCDFAATFYMYPRFVEAHPGALDRQINFALASYVLVVEDVYMVGYVFMVQGYTSWAWYRLCMALDGIAFLVAILLLRANGEEVYPTDVGFVESLARPTMSLLLAALFSRPVRVYAHELSLEAGCQHVFVHLNELKREEVHRLVGPTAAGNSSATLCSSARELQDERVEGYSHFTTKDAGDGMYVVLEYEATPGAAPEGAEAGGGACGGDAVL